MLSFLPPIDWSCSKRRPWSMRETCLARVSPHTRAGGALSDCGVVVGTSAARGHPARRLGLRFRLATPADRANQGRTQHPIQVKPHMEKVTSSPRSTESATASSASSTASNTYGASPPDTKSTHQTISSCSSSHASKSGSAIMSLWPNISAISCLML